MGFTMFTRSGAHDVMAMM